MFTCEENLPPLPLTLTKQFQSPTLRLTLTKELVDRKQSRYPFSKRFVLSFESSARCPRPSPVVRLPQTAPGLGGRPRCVCVCVCEGVQQVTLNHRGTLGDEVPPGRHNFARLDVFPYYSVRVHVRENCFWGSCPFGWTGDFTADRLTAQTSRE